MENTGITGNNLLRQRTIFRKENDEQTQTRAVEANDSTITIAVRYPECCIYRVAPVLRVLSEDSYMPRIISIGPFHHGNRKYAEMEERKACLLTIFMRGSPMTKDDIKREIKRNCEEKVRRCYSEPVERDSDKFVEMLLVDGAFILQFMLTFGWQDKGKLTEYKKEVGDENTGLFLESWQVIDITHDLMLMENQLPHFFLAFLDDLVSFTARKSCFHDMDVLPVSDLDVLCMFVWKRYKISDFWWEEAGTTHKFKHMVDMLRTFQLPDKRPTAKPSSGFAPNRFKCAKKLQLAGVKFEVLTQGDRCIVFNSPEVGTLSISTLQIDSTSRTLFANIMAYEQNHFQTEQYVSDYLIMMNILIRDSEELLLEKGIIQNELIGGGKVANLLTDLCKDVDYPHHQFCYESLCKDLDKYCNRFMQKWKASFNSTTWQIGATIVLILTIIQTLCSVLAMWDIKFSR